MPGKRCTEEVKIAAVKQQRGHRVSEVTERLGVSIQGRRVRSAIRTRTEALGVVDAGSVEKLIRTTNARPRRAGLPRSGSRWRIRGGLGRQAQPFESHTQGAQAPCSLPPGNKKPPEGGFFISWRKR